jgi:hypothetical protein
MKEPASWLSFRIASPSLQLHVQTRYAAKTNANAFTPPLFSCHRSCPRGLRPHPRRACAICQPRAGHRDAAARSARACRRRNVPGRPGETGLGLQDDGDGSGACAPMCAATWFQKIREVERNESPRYCAGSNMHCSVGLAILVKVGPISDCFEAGTHAFSMVGTPVSLMPRSSASRMSLSSTTASA